MQQGKRWIAKSQIVKRTWADVARGCAQDDLQRQIDELTKLVKMLRAQLEGTKIEFCRFDARGICRYGDWCRFKHVQRDHSVLEAPTARHHKVDAAPILFGVIEPAQQPNVQPSQATAQQKTPATAPQLLQPKQESKLSSSPPQPTQVQTLPTAQQSQSRVERKQPDENKHPPHQLPPRTVVATVKDEQQQALRDGVPEESMDESEAQFMREFRERCRREETAYFAADNERLRQEHEEARLEREAEDAWQQREQKLQEDAKRREQQQQELELQERQQLEQQRQLNERERQDWLNGTGKYRRPCCVCNSLDCEDERCVDDKLALARENPSTPVVRKPRVSYY